MSAVCTPLRVGSISEAPTRSLDCPLIQPSLYLPAAVGTLPKAPTSTGLTSDITSCNIVVSSSWNGALKNVTSCRRLLSGPLPHAKRPSHLLLPLPHCLQATATGGINMTDAAIEEQVAKFDKAMAGVNPRLSSTPVTPPAGAIPAASSAANDSSGNVLDSVLQGVFDAATGSNSSANVSPPACPFPCAALAHMSIIWLL